MILAYFKICCQFLPWCQLVDDSCTCKCLCVCVPLSSVCFWLLGSFHSPRHSLATMCRFHRVPISQCDLLPTQAANTNDCCGDNGRFHPFVIVVCLCAFMTLVVLRLPLPSSWSGSTANETVIFWAFKQIKFHLQWIWFTFHSSLGSLLNLLSSVLLCLCGLFAKRQTKYSKSVTTCHIYMLNNVLEIVEKYYYLYVRLKQRMKWIFISKLTQMMTSILP